MRKLLSALFTVAAMLVSIPALAQQTPATQASAPAAAPGAPAAPATGGAPAAAGGLPAIRHLVYQFGYNTKAADSGTGTGTTTIDITGLAKDGGMTVTATDSWWNTVNPRQTYTCEVYPDGGVTCSQPPNAISPIQLAIVPLLGQNYFTSLSSSPTSTWKQNYTVKATFVPGANSGFMGQVYTWNCAFDLTGKGPIPKAEPVILIHSTGAMKQQGGRYLTVNQKANIAYDPRINMPVYVDEAITLVPRLSVNQYTVEMKLIQTGQK